MKERRQTNIKQNIEGYPELQHQILKNLKGTSCSKEIYRQLGILEKQVEEFMYEEEKFRKKAPLFSDIKMQDLEQTRIQIRESLINQLNFDIKRSEKMTYCQAIKIILALDAIAIDGEVSQKGTIKGVKKNLSDKVETSYEFFKLMKKDNNHSDEEEVINIFKMIKD